MDAWPAGGRGSPFAKGRRRAYPAARRRRKKKGDAKKGRVAGDASGPNRRLAKAGQELIKPTTVWRTVRRRLSEGVSSEGRPFFVGTRRGVAPPVRKNERKVKGVEATGAVWVPERLEAATRTPSKRKEVKRQGKRIRCQFIWSARGRTRPTGSKAVRIGG
jgi:hypothetical protein